MDRREKLEQAISALEAQRDQLGDAVVDASIAPLQAELTRLGSAQVSTSSSPQPESTPINTRKPDHDPHHSDRRLVTVMYSVLILTLLMEGYREERGRHFGATLTRPFYQPAFFYTAAVYKEALSPAFLMQIRQQWRLGLASSLASRRSYGRGDVFTNCSRSILVTGDIHR